MAKSLGDFALGHGAKRLGSHLGLGGHGLARRECRADTFERPRLVGFGVKMKDTMKGGVDM